MAEKTGLIMAILPPSKDILTLVLQETITLMQGKTGEAMEHLQEALMLATGQTNAPLADAILKRLKSYRAGETWPKAH